MKATRHWAPVLMLQSDMNLLQNAFWSFSEESVFPSVVLCTIMYKITYFDDQGSWSFDIYTGKKCVSHKPISKRSCHLNSLLKLP